MISRTSLSLLGRQTHTGTFLMICNRINSTSRKYFFCTATDQQTSTSGNDSNTVTANVSEPHKGGFAKAMAKIEGHENFPKAVRFSQLIQMGDPQGKIAEGTIVHIVDDDLYIDFGGKFNCVCPRPHKNGSVYTLGKKVRLMIHDLELSTRFLGASSDLTILEADCSLLGLARREL